MKPKEVIQKIIEGNASFVKSHDNSYFKSHENRQTPIITMVSCSDSRVQCSAVLPDGINRIFCIRNIGNQVSSSEGSIDYGIYHLKTPVLLILGHSDCGAVKAYMGGYDNEPKTIQRELNRLSPAFVNINEKIEKVRAIKKNTNYQVQVALSKYGELVNKRELAIVGAFYDFANDFKEGHGKLHILSINGKKA